MLKAKSQILSGIVVLFSLTSFVGHGFAATVDSLTLSGLAGSTVFGAPRAEFSGFSTSAVSAIQKEPELFSNPDSNTLIGQMTGPAIRLPDNWNKRADPRPEARVLYFFASASDDQIPIRHSDTASEIETAGWQRLLPALPHASFRQRFHAQSLPTFLMFVAGLVGLIFLARGRPRRRGQLGLMT